MKNEAIAKFVEVNYQSIHWHETIKSIDVELIHRDKDSFIYLCKVKSTGNGELDIHTTLTIELANYQQLNNFESDYSIQSEEIYAMLEVQSTIMGDEISTKIFRPAPCNFTYWLNDEEKYLSIYIREDHKY